MGPLRLNLSSNGAGVSAGIGGARVNVGPRGRIQKDAVQASDEQRQRYVAQLADLAQKLTTAEKKNCGALSMAQQTKTGHVYVFSNIGSFGENVFKIVLTRRLEPLDRIRVLGDASVPFEFDVHAMILSEEAPALEHSLHRHFLASLMNKVNPRKEFFRVPIATIRQEIEKLGVEASWTLTSTAAEYKRSLATEKAIRENPASYEARVHKQHLGRRDRGHGRTRYGGSVVGEPG